MNLLREDPASKTGEHCGELLQSIYGTRDASAHWEGEYTRTLLASSFPQGAASPCHFFHETGNVRVLVHGNDFVVVGSRAGQGKFRDMIRKVYECTVYEIGPDEDQAEELRILGRVIGNNLWGIANEAGQRHIEAVMDLLGLEVGYLSQTPRAKDILDRREQAVIQPGRARAVAAWYVEGNPAYMLTKGLDADSIRKCLCCLGFKARRG